MTTTEIPTQSLSIGGGGGSGTFTQDTIAVIEALTPAAGDYASATDGPYEYRCFTGGTWQAYCNGYAVTRPTFSDWTAANMDATSTFTEDSGMPTLALEAAGGTVTRSYAWRALADDTANVLGVIWPPMFGTSGSTDLAGVGFMESSSGKFTLLQYATDNPSLKIRNQATVDGAPVGAELVNIQGTSTGSIFPGDRRVYFRLSRGSGDLTWEYSESPKGPWFQLLQTTEGAYFDSHPDRILWWYNNRNTSPDGLKMSLSCDTVT